MGGRLLTLCILCFVIFAVADFCFAGTTGITAKGGTKPPGGSKSSGGVPSFGGGNGIFGGVPGVPGNWGGVFGGPLGGVIGGGVSQPSITCTDPGPCYRKKLTCPSRCFKSSGKWGPKGGGGGGGGGCTMDCKNKCRAYC